LTKSDLVLRDIDALQSMKNASVSVSVAFNENDVRRLFEANTIDTGKRVSALKQLQSSGSRTAALLCPVIPYITEVIPLIEMLAEQTEKILIYGLSIANKSDRNWQNVDKILEDHFPDLKSKIKSAVFSRNHAYWTRLRAELSEFQKKCKTTLSVHI